jgi:hypothetical protein
MLLVGVFIAGPILTSRTGIGTFLGSWRGRRHHHPGLIAGLFRRNGWIRYGGMRHQRAWQFDRGRNALHGQQRDEYP